jgi:hypothetical protein
MSREEQEEHMKTAATATLCADINKYGTPILESGVIAGI